MVFEEGIGQSEFVPNRCLGRECSQAETLRIDGEETDEP